MLELDLGVSDPIPRDCGCIETFFQTLYDNPMRRDARNANLRKALPRVRAQ
jgi:hypothetical protein